MVRLRANHLHIPILCLERSYLSADSSAVPSSQVSTTNKSFICTWWLLVCVVEVASELVSEVKNARLRSGPRPWTPCYAKESRVQRG